MLRRLYAVSLAYKESPNCRLEANYAHQQNLDMIPLLMQESYQPAGKIVILFSICLLPVSLTLKVSLLQVGWV